jgi:uncharacterized protein YndB with AHSA1/START domain
MGHGATTTFHVPIASGTSTSSDVNLGRAWHRVLIDPTGAGGEVRFQGAPNSGSANPGTYRTVQWPAAVSGTAGTATVASALSGSIVEVPLAGLQWVKVYATGTIANGATLKLICSDL